MHTLAQKSNGAYKTENNRLSRFDRRKGIVSEDFRITRGRGIWVDKNGFLIMPTFHPAALFRDETKKAPFWHDLKEIKRKYEEIRAEK